MALRHSAKQAQERRQHPRKHLRVSKLGQNVCLSATKKAKIAVLVAVVPATRNFSCTFHVRRKAALVLTMPRTLSSCHVHGNGWGYCRGLVVAGHQRV